MRTALLSAVERTETGELRAGLLLGGRSVLDWQGEYARILGCERIICLCDTPGSQVLDLQRSFEGSGGEFHAVRGNMQIVSLVRADDELVMMRDGLVVDVDLLSDWIGPEGKLRKAIATLPAKNAMVEAQPAEFERIDRERHWAGLAAFSASKVHKLADMPPDGDAMSMLLRLALQSQVVCQELTADTLQNSNWLIASGGQALASREQILLDQHAPRAHWLGPGRSISAAIVRRIAPRGLENGGNLSAGIAAVLMAGAIGLAGIGQAAASLGTGALGVLALAFGGHFSMMRSALWSKPVGRIWQLTPDYLVEGLVLGILLYCSYLLGVSATELTLPIAAVGVSHYLGFRRSNSMSAFWSDRTTHLAGFALAAATGVLPEAVAVFTLAAIIDLLVPRANSQNDV